MGLGWCLVLGFWWASPDLLPSRPHPIEDGAWVLVRECGRTTVRGRMAFCRGGGLVEDLATEGVVLVLV